MNSLKKTISFAEGSSVPNEIYDNSFFVWATNIANVLKIDKIKPGTIIIDDSGPHCFPKDEAIKRLHSEGDILFTEGGVLESQKGFKKTTFLPQAMTKTYLSQYQQHFLKSKEITGCILSSLLSAKFMNLKPEIGLIDTKESYLHYKKLSQLEFIGASLHCDEYLIPQKYIKKFFQDFGE